MNDFNGIETVWADEDDENQFALVGEARSIVLSNPLCQ
jgi:hypothetical protein